MNIRIEWLTIVLTAIINLSIALLCDSATEATNTHWLHGIEYKQYSSVAIIWVFGIITLFYGLSRKDATRELGLLIIVFSSFLAVRFCWFG